MIKNIGLLIGLSLLGTILFFVVNRHFSNKNPVIEFTEQITSPEFTKNLLEDGKSKGAQLFFNLCTQCHEAPEPNLYSSAQWDEYLIKKQASLKATQKTKPAILLPNTEEITLISTFLSKKTNQ